MDGSADHCSHTPDSLPKLPLLWASISRHMEVTAPALERTEAKVGISDQGMRQHRGRVSGGAVWAQQGRSRAALPALEGL